ncbi:uncharacterized protein KRP23_6571 [Phytophthora ramorum]|uniref:uncharacterized protein n=1 Tax=Phytophthora ramorum TaxID=164328 RepID=UPI0030B643D5|nr:hypothetical protein KRP23_6571 [Phytophthora ramorum]
MAVIDDSKVRDAIYVGIKTPKAVSNQDDAKMRASHAVKLTSGFWLTFLVPLLQPFQYAVNLWVIGGMFGSLYCGPLAQRLGRKKVFTINAIVMFIGSVIQTTSFDIAQFIVGRFIAVFFTCCMPETMGKTSGEIQAWFSGEKSEPAHSQQ